MDGIASAASPQSDRAGEGSSQTQISESLGPGGNHLASPSNLGRLPEDSEQAVAHRARKIYSREVLLRARGSHLVRESPISLESEIFRELQVDGGFDVSANPQQTPARAVATAQQLGSQEPPVWKDDSWRTNNRYKTQGSTVTGSPPTGPQLKSRLVDDGLLSGSPEKEKASGSANQRPMGPGWRRPEWGSNEMKEGTEAWRGTQRMAPNGREEGERDRRTATGGNEETWRPPPPGLGRGQPRGGNNNGGPPGLTGGGDQWERPWGAGRGKPIDGERRQNGKPRDPPGVMPPRETNRDPGTRPQLPEGWNKPRDDLKNGSKGKEPSKPREALTAGGRRQSDDSRRGDPAWMADDSEDWGDEGALLEERRQEFEAERRAMQVEREREKAARLSKEGSEAELDLIHDDEIEAMRREALEEEREERSLESEAGQPPRPASALAAAMEFNVDSLFADDHEGPPAPLSQRAESTDAVQDGASRFGRWFQLEHSPSTAKSLPPQLEQQPVSQQSATEPQQSDSFAEKQQQQSANEAAHIQQFLSSRTQQLSGPGDELSRNLLAQLQQGQPPSANIAQSLQAAQSQMNKMPRPFTDMERLMLERQLQGSRDSQILPKAPTPQPRQQPFNHNSSNHALLQLLQGHAMQGDQKMMQRPGALEPTFANPNPQMQQQQLLNGLQLGGHQGNPQQHPAHNGAGMNANLLEQLQQLRLAQSEQQHKQQAQHARDQQQLAQYRQQILQQQAQQQLHQGQGLAPAQNSLLAAFSAQMPREIGASKPLADELFNFGPKDNLRLSQPGLGSQPQHLGLGRAERTQNLPYGQNMNYGQTGQASLAHLLQNPQFAHLRQQASQLSQQGNSNPFSGAPYNFPQAGTQLGQPGLGGQSHNLSQFAGQQLAGQQGFNHTNQGLGGHNPESIARFMAQQRELEAAQQAAQHQKLLQQHRILQMQQLAQQQHQQQQREAAQRAALLQQQRDQQQQQQHLGGLGASRLTPAEAVLRQQQMMHFQALNQARANTSSAPDTEALARFLAQNGGGSLSNLGLGRQQ